MGLAERFRELGKRDCRVCDGIGAWGGTVPRGIGGQTITQCTECCGTGIDPLAYRVLRNALLVIAEVVEAAEEISGYGIPPDSMRDDTYTNGETLRIALANLSKELDGTSS